VLDGLAVAHRARAAEQRATARRRPLLFDDAGACVDAPAALQPRQSLHAHRLRERDRVQQAERGGDGQS